MILNKTYDELQAMRRVLETHQLPVGISIALQLVDQLLSAMDDLEDAEKKLEFLESSLDDLRFQLNAAHAALSDSE